MNTDYLAKLMLLFEPRREKTCLRGFRPGPKQTGCRATDDGQRHEISDLGRRGVFLNLISM